MQPADPPAGPPFVLQRSEVRTIRSSRGDAYRLLLAWPAEPPPPSGYPVVYLLDANASFGSLVEGIRMRSRRSDATGVLPAIVVGLDYPVDDPQAKQRRVFDFTPPIAASPSAPGRASLADGESGGADLLLDLLRHEVRSALSSAGPIDVSRQVLFGHSLGGLFVLHAMLTAPGLFETGIAISPSIWWDRDRLHAMASHGGQALARTRILIAVGEYEQVLAPWQRPRAGESTASIAARRTERRMVDDARELTTALATVVAEAEFARLDGEDHASALGVGMQRSLRFALAPR